MSQRPATMTSHAVMFHHFNDELHPPGQGSLTGKQFEEMLDWLTERHTILDAEEFMWRTDTGCLRDNDICLSFDDALLCQVDIAVPILDKRNIKAFFFVYSSPFYDDPDPLEIYRYFRTVVFDDVNAFYSEFFAEAERVLGERYILAKVEFNPDEYLNAFPFYSDSDRWFRYLRNMTLTKSEYDVINSGMMASHGFDRRTAIEKLWMTESQLVSLFAAGHKIGLHSFSHPTMIHELPPHDQIQEYRRNFDHLTSVLGEAPDSMSHPCGNYSSWSLAALRELGIRIGFRSNYAITEIRSNLEVPREDSTNLLNAMQL
jgi:peptidoglycan/xylan/chitin deacetylase (PgdA/CDA1 family)